MWSTQLVSITRSDIAFSKSFISGDVVINNTALYCIRKYSGELKWDSESKNMKFFDLDNLPENQNDPDLIEVYKRKFCSRGR
jgi:type IV secretory pathway ATPase VirB11/archaellum biosynthesis ATPase